MLIPVVHGERHPNRGGFLAIEDQPLFRYLLGMGMSKLMDLWRGPRWGWDYWIWSRVISWSDRNNKIKFEVAVPHTCDTAAALWGRPFCYHKEDDERADH